MRRLFLLISVFMLFGCTKINQQNNEYIEIVENVLANNNKYVNNSSKGYKYYLPIGVSIKKNINNNTILAINDINVYLYVDVISYYYKKNIEVSNSKDYDYVKDLGDNGYLIIDENNGYYFVNLNYNYSNIEFYTEKKNLNRLLTLSSIILNSIEYNNSIIKSEIINKDNYSSDKLYKFEELEKNSSNFSKYLNSYVDNNNEEDKLPE